MSKLQILINNMASRVATPIRTGLATESSPVFMLMATGQIESAEVALVGFYDPIFIYFAIVSRV